MVPEIARFFWRGMLPLVLMRRSRPVLTKYFAIFYLARLTIPAANVFRFWFRKKVTELPYRRPFRFRLCKYSSSIAENATPSAAKQSSVRYHSVIISEISKNCSVWIHKCRTTCRVNLSCVAIVQCLECTLSNTYFSDNVTSRAFYIYILPIVHCIICTY